ncbi:MAG: cell division protein ZapA [Gammaproteobacteria bacterium]|nr:cell division protein ZapA [Gammaproteobacteria bacterium]
MLSSEVDVAIINIMGREFKIKCPKDKINELQKAADYLNSKMQEVQHGDRLIGIDRVAITAALNIAHELILEKQSLKTDFSNNGMLDKRVSDLKQKVDQALASLA